jgi:hypothetical protein
MRRNGGENAWRQAGAAKVPESNSRLLPGRGLRPDDYRVTPRQFGSEAVRGAMCSGQCFGRLPRARTIAAPAMADGVGKMWRA